MDFVSDFGKCGSTKLHIWDLKSVKFVGTGGGGGWFELHNGIINYSRIICTRMHKTYIKKSVQFFVLYTNRDTNNYFKRH